MVRLLALLLFVIQANYSKSSLIRTCSADTDCKVLGERCFQVKSHGCNSGMCVCEEGRTYKNITSRADCVIVKKPRDVCSTPTGCVSSHLQCVDGKCQCKSYLKEVNGACEFRGLDEACGDDSDCVPAFNTGIWSGDQKLKKMYEGVQCFNYKCQCKSGYRSAKVTELVENWDDYRLLMRSVKYCFKQDVKITWQNKTNDECDLSPQFSLQSEDEKAIRLCGSGLGCTNCPLDFKKASETVISYQQSKLVDINRKCKATCRLDGTWVSECCGVEMSKIDYKEIKRTTLVGKCQNVNRSSGLLASAFRIISVAIFEACFLLFLS